MTLLTIDELPGGAARPAGADGAAGAADRRLRDALMRRPPAGRPAVALWALGFRPFYLAAAAYAALSVLLWWAQFALGASWAMPAGAPGHAHEMVFGFTLAVVVGFLLTAARQWTGRPTPAGAALAALLGLWAAARVSMWLPWPAAAAALNVTFPLAAAVALARPLWAVRQWRNAGFVALLVAMAAASGAFHAALEGWVDVAASDALRIGLDAVLVMMVLMTGRVLPMFTRNGVPGSTPGQHRVLERAALGGVLLLGAADAAALHGVALPAAAAGLLAAAVAAVHAVRWALWKPWQTWRVPLVAVLHVACAWIPVHLALRALAAFGAIAPSAATHALTAGAIGGLTIGMMTRTARGHTGRPLRADRMDQAMYAAVTLGAVARVVGPIVAPQATGAWWAASAAAWAAGFALYAVHYGPWLWHARADGKPG